MSVESDIKAAFTAGTLGGGGGVSPETAATFREQLTARGIPAEQTNATLARHGVGVDQSKQPSTETAPVTPQRLAVDIDPATGLPRLTAAQVEQAAATLRAHWSGSPEELERALAAAGAKPLAPAAPDTRTPEEVEYDNSPLAAPVDPTSYDLNGIWLNRDVDLATLAQTDRAMRSSMAELRVPVALARQFGEDLIAGAAKWSGLAGNELAAKSYSASENALFARTTRVSWAQAAAEMKSWLAGMSEGTRSYLANSGALESAAVRTRLYQSYQLQKARAGMKGKS